MSHSAMLRALWLSLAYKLSVMDPVRIVNEMAGWVKGVQVHYLNDLSVRIVREVLLPSVYKEAAGEIERHRSNKAKIVILSSAPEAVCREMASSLGFNDIVCSELESINSVLTGQPVRPLCFGEEKGKRLLEYCEINNTSPSACWFYGDSFADFHALSLVGHPVCINPDKRLFKEALKNNWEIHNWR